MARADLVNTRYVVGILDALRACKDIALDEELIGIYEKWIKDHPYDEGEGWGLVPWSQEEMPVTEEMLQTASGDDVALVILGRTAGEDQDNTDKPGSYKLTRTEEDLIRKVSSQFSRTAVILNVGNIIDMKWVREFDPAAVLYAWQGGQEGGNGVCDVLTGRVNPCGKLTDTIAEDISDYPSTSNFGDLQKNYYKEDIYVGYRYFETFAKDKVLYPSTCRIQYDGGIHKVAVRDASGFICRQCSCVVMGWVCPQNEAFSSVSFQKYLGNLPSDSVTSVYPDGREISG